MLKHKTKKYAAICAVLILMASSGFALVDAVQSGFLKTTLTNLDPVASNKNKDKNIVAEPLSTDGEELSTEEENEEEIDNEEGIKDEEMGDEDAEDELYDEDSEDEVKDEDDDDDSEDEMDEEDDDDELDEEDFAEDNNKLKGWEKPKKQKKYIKESKVKERLGDSLELDENEDADFSDLTRNHKHYNAIEYLVQLGVLDGYPDGTFQADKPVNRGEALKIILEGLKLEGMPGLGQLMRYKFKFPDAESDEWYSPYLKYAVDNEILQGYMDGTIKLESQVSKVEFLKMLFLSAELSEDDIVVEGYEFPSDVTEEDWFAPFVIFALDNTLVELDEEGLFNPHELLDRGTGSEIVYRFFQIITSDEEATDGTVTDADTTDEEVVDDTETIDMGSEEEVVEEEIIEEETILEEEIVE